MNGKRALCAALCLVLCLSGCQSGGTALPPKESDAPSQAVGPAKEPESYAGTIPEFASARERLGNMEKIAADGDATLYFDETTGDIALEGRGSLFFSTPWDLSANTETVDSQKERIASQVRLTYLDNQQKISEIYSFPECVAKGQYTIEPLEKGLRVNMVIGRAEQRTLLPEAVPASRFDRLLTGMDERTAARMKAFYRLYDPKSTPENQLALIRERFPVVDSQAIYVLRTVTDREKNELEGYFAAAGYTFQDMEADLEAVGASEGETVSPRFELSVQYELTDGRLQVSVPTSLISYDEGHYTLLEIGVLEYFGAAPRTQEGYLLIPDGCGAVVGFNREGDKLGNDIRMPIYGYDRALTYTAGYENLMTASLPVFGIVSPQGSLFASVEEGAAMTDIIANSGGNVSGYARVGTAMAYRDYDSFEYKDVNTQYAWTIADKTPFDGTYRVEYTLLDVGAGYGEMAACYRETLNLEKKGEGLKTVIGLYGSVKHEEQVLFVPVKRQVALTTFDDAAALAEELHAGGIENLDLRYLGWGPGGLDATAFTSAPAPKVLGGKSALKSLKNRLEKIGVGLYFDADFAYVANTRAFDGFNPNRDASRMLNKTYSGYNEVRLSSGLMNEKKFRYTLRPEAMLAFYEKFTGSYEKLGLTGLSVGTLGYSLNSDKDGSGGVSRAEAQRYAEALLNRASGKYTLMTEGANRYVYDYADCLLSLPASATGYPDADYSVPFLQMVLHGSLPYTTAPINLSGNYRTEVLKAIETGAGLYFGLACRNTDLLKTSTQADLYSVDYGTWKEKIFQCCRRVDEAVGDLAEVPIVGYTCPAEGISRVEYENGTLIYVNYTDENYTAEGSIVPARDYLRLEQGVRQ